MLRFTKVLVLSVVACLTACETYTKQAVCNENNAGGLEGITGNYYIASLDEDFNRRIDDISIIMDGSEARLKMRWLQKGVQQDLSLCNVGPHHVIEAHDDESGFYSQAKLSVTNVGLQLSPLYYDRSQLKLAGIGTEILELGAEKLLKNFKKFSEGETSLVIDNSSVNGRTLLGLAVQGPYSVNFIRR